MAEGHSIDVSMPVTAERLQYDGGAVAYVLQHDGKTVRVSFHVDGTIVARVDGVIVARIRRA
jgi:hypothetical protein